MVAEETVFARLLALVTGHRQFQRDTRGQREQNDHPHDRLPATRLLGGLLRIGLLVLRRVGHRGRRAIDDSHTMSVPKPTFVHRAVDIAGCAGQQFVTARFGKLTACRAVRAGFGGSGLAPLTDEPRNQPPHGRSATVVGT